ncbi:MAG: c-type cytochrome [Pseudomonadota bacterium]
MKKTLLLVTFLAFIFLAAMESQAGDAAAGKKTWDSVCVACHGAQGEGNVALNAPANGGQDEWYVIRQLKNFKAGIRGSHEKDTYGAQMRPMAMTLADDKAIEDVSAYVSSLPAPKVEATVSGNADAGKKHYAVCTACHGAQGEGNKSLNAPRLTGQHAWYLARQLEYFRDGIRGSHAKDIYGQQMVPMSMTLATEEQVNDVVAYIISLEQ